MIWSFARGVLRLGTLRTMKDGVLRYGDDLETLVMGPSNAEQPHNKRLLCQNPTAGRKLEPGGCIARSPASSEQELLRGASERERRNSIP